ncbi:Glycogen debranching enzyme [Rhodobacteraceae bacterium THAF1]|uniref:glycogen debranching protein GlgX n=1 Tax=Palleronia sp. THAF1 TaxID=2587842 RepID=UPI000F3CF404|nr:glycogen debranching protein GlgX [Palleronia sp. THAF1]QFU09191.1 Glycogen debranching enzyme [Palleronia sp. THAF1]VDC27291.1 Glycogen debranching enzyme [Rhodobacteraceae bacterium THAF1]
MKRFQMTAGRAAPVGATFDGDGVNFAVFSQNASRMELCLFDENGTETRIDLPERNGDVWHGYISGLTPGTKYGYRAHGAYAPEEGHRFNPAKLLMDPYAKQLTGHPAWHDALMGYTVGKSDLVIDPRDSAPYMPRSVVVDPSFSWGRDLPPQVPVRQSVIYEAHVKGLTAMRRDVRDPGTFMAMASDPMLDYLTDLGITAIELLPAQAFLTDRFLHEKKLTNYWGYQTLGFFAPEPRYMARQEIAEFQQMVARFHGAGIEVIMDVVYNHTCEGNELGPTLSFRGLDNASYYRLEDNPRHYVNDTGCGNTLNVDHPMVLRMIMDSLRYWVEVMHVDGFRFDLCSTLGRAGTGGFDQGAAFFDAVRQDPVLTGVKLIAEPWDIGPGGYQLGGFPPPFLEWNDKFRDRVRMFWRGDEGSVPGLADRLTGSALQFDHSGRPATASVNLLTAHDGFTLQDTVSYNEKHNDANGEDGRDGHGENYSDNLGVEGPTKDAEIKTARARRKRNMMATLMLSQGTPMLLAGDEIGNSQGGNNNAYAQDNETSWIDWSKADEDFHAFTRDMIAFRREHPLLRQKLFLHSRERSVDGREDLFWWQSNGKPMTQAAWDDASQDAIAMELRMASGTPEYAETEQAIFAVFNRGDARDWKLPPPPKGMSWDWRIDTADPDRVGELVFDAVTIPADSVAVFVLWGSE